MIILSYFTKNFFEELIEKDLDIKVGEHFNNILKNKMFFFIGNQDSYKRIIKKNINKIKQNQKKSNLIEKIIRRAGWINLPFECKDLHNLFMYLNKKNVYLDFIYSSNNERLKRIGEIKKLRKKTLNMVISSNRIISEEKIILNNYKKKIENKHEFDYSPREKFERVKIKKSFINWFFSMSKIIFVCDKIFIYDRYIAANLIDAHEPKSPFNSPSYFKTLKFISKFIDNCFVGKKNFKCEILCILKKAQKINNSEINIGKNKILKWNFFKQEVARYLDCLGYINKKIDIKDWQLWNNIHDRYWKFYYGGSLIGALKFNPGVDFIKDINTDYNKPRIYEFDYVDKPTIHKKEGLFKSLVDDKRTAYSLEKAS